jgi:hypothetical protein
MHRKPTISVLMLGAFLLPSNRGLLAASRP